MPTPTWLIHEGLVKEVTWGTPLAASTFYPVKNPKHIVKYETINDDGFRSNAAMTQGYFQGPGHTEITTGDMNFYPDDSGHLLMGLFGADAITGAGPYTHALTLLNTALPPSYTFVKYDGNLATARSAAGCYIEELSMKFVNPGRLTLAAKAKGKIETNVTKPTNTYSTQAIYMPWQGALTLGGAGNTKLINLDMTIKRPVDLIFGMSNSQDATAANVGPMQITGKMTFAITDFTEINYYLNNTQPITSLVFTSGANTMTIVMSKTAFQDPTELDHGSNYAKVTASFEAIANSTDAGAGNSPAKITLVNTKAVAF